MVSWIKWLEEKYPDKIVRIEDRKNSVIVYIDTYPYGFALRLCITK